MGKTSVLFGVLLIVVGLIGFIASGVLHGTYAVTALIPAFVGIPIAICGVIAGNEKLRMHAMHGAVLIALIGFLMAVGRSIVSASRGGLTGLGAFSLISMAVLTGVFVFLCVRSFIAARKARKAGAV